MHKIEPEPLLVLRNLNSLLVQKLMSGQVKWRKLLWKYIYSCEPSSWPNLLDQIKSMYFYIKLLWVPCNGNNIAYRENYCEFLDISLKKCYERTKLQKPALNYQTKLPTPPHMTKPQSLYSYERLGQTASNGSSFFSEKKL